MQRRIIGFVLAILIVSACRAPVSSPDAVSLPPPTGLGVCHSASSSIDSAFGWQYDTTTPLHWKVLNPKAGVFEFSALDTLVSGFQGKDSKLWLSIQTAGADLDGNRKVPQWVIDAGATWHKGNCSYSYAATFYPGDEIYQLYLDTLLRAIAAHIDSKPQAYRDTLGGIVMMSGGPYGEMQLMSCNMYGAWQAFYNMDVGELNTDYAESVKEIINIYASAFPDMPLILQLGFSLNTQQASKEVEIIEYALSKYGRRVILKWAGFDPGAVGNKYYGDLLRVYSSRTSVGFEPGHPEKYMTDGSWDPVKFQGIFSSALSAKASFMCFQRTMLPGLMATPGWREFDTNLEANGGVTPTPIPDYDVYPGEDLQAAVYAAASAGKVLNVYGTHYINSAISVPSGATIEGHGSTISGGTVVSGWQRHTGNVWKALLPRKVRQLYVNGGRATIAREPDADYYTLIDWDTDERVIRVNAADASGVPVGTEMFILKSWNHDILRISNISIGDGVATIVPMDQERWLTFEGTNPPKRPEQPYFWQNSMALLDQQREFYSDGTWVYYIPAAGENMETATVVAPLATELMNIDGASNVSITGLTFKHTHWEPTTGGLVGVEGGRYRSKPYIDEDVWSFISAAVVVSDSDNVSIDRCTFTDLGGSAIEFTGGVANSSITYCLIEDIAGVGIGIQTEYGNRNIADGIVVSDNTIRRAGLDYWGSIGVWAGTVKNTSIVHNEISDLYYQSINIGMNVQTGEACCNHVDYNYLHNLCLRLSDGGGVHTLQVQSGSTIIANHITDIRRISIHDHGVHGIYLDNFTEGFTVDRNVIERVSGWRSYPIFINEIMNACQSDCTIGDNTTYREDVVDGAGPRQAVPTWTPTPAPTWSPTPTPTWSPTPVPTWTPTPIPTWSPTPTPTWSPTPTPTWSPTPTPTPTPTPAAWEMEGVLELHYRCTEDGCYFWIEAQDGMDESAIHTLGLPMIFITGK